MKKKITVNEWVFVRQAIGASMQSIPISQWPSSLSTQDMRVRKSWIWGESNLRFYFRHWWTTVHQIKCASAGVISICNAVFSLTTSYCIPGIIAMKSRSFPKLGQNFDVLGPTDFWDRAPVAVNKQSELHLPTLFFVYGTNVHWR